MPPTDNQLREAVAREDEVVAQLGDVPSGVRRVPRPGRRYDERGNVRPSDSRSGADGEEGEDNRVGAVSRPADKHIEPEVLQKEEIASQALQAAQQAIQAPEPLKVELVEHARARGLATSGTKEELQARIEAHDAEHPDEQGEEPPG